MKELLELIKVAQDKRKERDDFIKDMEYYHPSRDSYDEAVEAADKAVEDHFNNLVDDRIDRAFGLGVYSNDY